MPPIVTTTKRPKRSKKDALCLRQKRGNGSATKCRVYVRQANKEKCHSQKQSGQFKIQTCQTRQQLIGVLF